MPECNHEEEDTRIPIYLKDALENCATTCLVICTVNTDVIVIIVGKLYCSCVNSIWNWKNLLHINAICNALGREKSISLPFFTQLLAMIQPVHFWGKERSHHGMHGKH